MTQPGRPRLRVPEPPARPGQSPRFDHIPMSPAGAVGCPPIDVDPADTKPFAYQLIRILDDAGKAVGPWADYLGNVDADVLRRGLRDMMKTRFLDKRMLLAHRQGKTTNYAASTGEEAITCGFQRMLSPGDMNFPTYRQQGLLVASGYPLEKFMGLQFGNDLDPVEGKNLPPMISARDYGYFTISGNLATQYVQSVGWAMASAISGDDKVAAGWIGDGAAAEGDFHSALLYASVYRPPAVLNLINNQWAISSFVGIAGGHVPLACRAHGYGLASIRVDGNDFLAVMAAAKWAIARARQGHGAILIEWVTYRAAAHSTSDDPTVYRPKEEAAAWPLGDPIERLKQHLVAIGEWSDERHAQAQGEVEEEILGLQKLAESHGTMIGGGSAPLSAIFEKVYKDMPEHIRRQRQKAGI